MKYLLDRRFLSLYVISLVVCFFLIPFANLGFDSIHEGVNVASALGLKNGLVIHQDILEMKGLAFPFFLSFFSGVNTVHYILFFKLLNTLLIVINAFLVFFSTRHVSEILARNLVCLWLICNPVLTNYTFGNIHGSFFISPNNLTVTLILLIIFINFLLSQKTMNAFAPGFLPLTMALIAGILPWIRIQNVFFSASVLVFLMISKQTRVVKSSILISFCISSLTPMIYLALHDGLLEWLDQIFVYPFKLNELRDSSTFISPMVLVKTILICLLYFFAFSLLLRFTNDSKKKLKVAFVLVLLSSPLALVISMRYKIEPKKRFDLMNWLIILSNNWPSSVFRSLVVSSLILLAYVSNRALRDMLRIISFPKAKSHTLLSKFFNYPSPNSLLVIAGFQAVIYLYPNFGNLWEVAPLLIVSFFALLHYCSAKFERVLASLFTALVLSFTIGAIVNVARFSLLERYYYTSPPLAGIYETDSSKVKDFEELNQVLGNTSGKILNECNSSLLVFPNGEFRSISRHYVNLAYRRVATLSETFPSIVVTCSNVPTTFNLREYYLAEELELSSGEIVRVFLGAQKK